MSHFYVILFDADFEGHSVVAVRSRIRVERGFGGGPEASLVGDLEANMRLAPDYRENQDWVSTDAAGLTEEHIQSATDTLCAWALRDFESDSEGCDDRDECDEVAE